MNNLISEYNNLFNKLNTIAEHHNNLFIFTLTSSGAILTFAIQQNNVYIALVNMIILILLRCRVMSYRDEYYIILAYIRKILEPKLNLNSQPLIKVENSKISNIHYFIYSILALGTIAVCLLLNAMNKIVVMVSLVFFFVVLLLDIYYFFFAKKLYQQYENQIHE